MRWTTWKFVLRRYIPCLTAREVSDHTTFVLATQVAINVHQERKMLNQSLYQSLKTFPGGVKVIKEGEEASLYIDSYDILGTRCRVDHNRPSGEEYVVRCPFCGDSSHHLYISYLSLSCPIVDGHRMSPMPLMAKCFRRDCIKDPSNRQQLIKAISSGLDSLDSPTIRPSDVGDEDQGIDKNLSNEATLQGILTWAPDFHLCASTTMPEVVADYLDERRVSKRDMETFALGWGTVSNPYTGTPVNRGEPHVLIPVVVGGKLVGIQARRVLTGAIPKERRYWMHPGMRKSSCLLNIDNANRIGLAVVCEGAFDAISVGKVGVCTFGSSISPMQRQMLSSVRDAVIWLPDMDENDRCKTLATAEREVAIWNNNLNFPKGAHVVKLSKKDAGSMTRNEVWLEIIKQLPTKMVDYVASTILPQL